MSDENIPYLVVVSRSRPLV